MVHDFKKFPELTNSQMPIYYFDSPHKQILEDFQAKVTRVKDGDTIQVKWNERDFEFPIRMAEMASAETDEGGGKIAKEHLAQLIEGKEVDVIIDKKNRVGKWGRLIGNIVFGGININQQMINDGFATTFKDRKQGTIPDFNKELDAQ